MTIDAYAYVAELTRERNAYREALLTIAEQDWVENVLDPQWAARIAADALRESRVAGSPPDTDGGAGVLVGGEAA